MICRTYEKTIWLIAYNILQNRDWAYEAGQTALVKLIEKTDKLMKLPDNEVKAYILRAARNTAFDFYDKEKRSRHIELEKVEYLLANEFDHNLLDALAAKDTYKTVISKIKHLPSNYKDVIILKYIDEFSYGEIADILGISVSNVGVRISRALNKLRDILDIEGGDIL